MKNIESSVNPLCKNVPSPQNYIQANCLKAFDNLFKINFAD